MPQRGLPQQVPQAQAHTTNSPPTDNLHLLLAAQHGGLDGHTIASTQAQANREAFGRGNGFTGDGFFIEDNALWIGTIVPGVLVTAINTDLPGNIVARVTENIYDSRTGRILLIPQGTILFARYNSSVSYAQRRVQIAWDTLIRPDGYQLELGGMGAVDRAGMAGQEAVYHENWFEYLKAAGIIAAFSIANARMTEEAARHTSSLVAGGIAQSNAEFVAQIGGGIVSRAMNVQPTLTVDSGTTINILLNRNLMLPPFTDFPVVQRYRLE
jgi:type IV secretion system protein VirB10